MSNEADGVNEPGVTCAMNASLLPVLLKLPRRSPGVGEKAPVVVSPATAMEVLPLPTMVTAWAASSPTR